VPLPLAAVLALLAATLATGALHEDGLADLCDGFGGGRDRARRLEIMRDSRIGSYGALALGFAVLIRVLALSSLSGSTGTLALIGLSAVSRAPLPLALWLMPPARHDGLGRAAAGVGARRSLLAAGFGLGFFALCLPGALFALPVMALAAFGLARLAMARIGGQTGDVLGAMQVVTELVGWLCLSTLIQQ
jgi:adenosylcobinamide-GDP ribazoletransferase